MLRQITWAVLALSLTLGTAQAASEQEVIVAYGKVAATYPLLVEQLLRQGQNTKACQKAKILDLVREGYQSPSLGQKLAKYNPWVYRNFTRSFDELKVVMNYCYTHKGRTEALRAARSMAYNATLE